MQEGDAYYNRKLKSSRVELDAREGWGKRGDEGRKSLQS